MNGCWERHVSFCQECYHVVLLFSWCCHAVCPFFMVLSCRVSFCQEWCHADLCIQLRTKSAGVSLWRRMNQRRNCSPQPDTRAPISSQVQLGACACLARDGVPSPGSKSKLPPRGTRWPTLRPGPGQDSCGGLLPCLHKHTELGGRCSIPGCANTP